ncbi:MAG: polysaccharide biosynthesis C-terminal domain-containing protein [Cytophagaceae bacterium]|jgi:O-antigen/teichoic acid export membrane protein|nr:polysaccharide biosynthesis C-terminal domain-containing protein [Cytophagaceae bacterium]
MIKPVALVLENIIQDQLGHDIYGKWAALNALAFICSFLLDLGIQQFYIRQFQSAHRASAVDDIPYLNGLKYTTALLFPIIVIIVALLLGYTGTDLWMMGGIGLFYSIMSLILHVRMFFQTYHQLNMDSISGTLDKALFIGLAILFILLEGTVLDFIGIKLLSVTMTFLFLAYWWNRQHIHSLYQTKGSIRKWKAIIQTTYPLALITILYSIHDKIDQIMVNKLIDDRASGLYAAAYRWLDAILMFLWVLMPLFYTRFCKKLEAKEDTTTIVMTGQLFTAMVMSWVMAFILFFGEHFFILFKNSTPNEIVEMTAVFKVLSGMMLIQGIAAIYGAYIMALNGERFLNKVSIGLILLNVVLNGLSIPYFGIIGAAWATVISGFTAIIYYIYFLQQKNQNVFTVKHIRQLITHVVLALSITYSLRLWNAPIEVTMGMLGICFLVVFWVSGIFKKLKEIA